MTLRQAGLYLGVALVSLALGWGLMAGLGRVLRTPTIDEAVDAGPAPTPTPAAPDAAPVPKINATLYFASEDGLHLVPVSTEVPLAVGVVAQARSIVEAQLTAPAPEPLASTIPPGTTLRGVFVSAKNEAFVDLDGAIRSAHPGGTLDETLTVYTIVNALMTNLPTLQQVQILVDGQEVDTLAGHVDLRRPLTKNESLILSEQP